MTINNKTGSLSIRELEDDVRDVCIEMRAAVFDRYARNRRVAISMFEIRNMIRAGVNDVAIRQRIDRMRGPLHFLRGAWFSNWFGFNRTNRPK